MGALLASSAIGGGLDLIGQQMTNAANMAMVKQQEDFQAQMSGTAHQREVADLRKAGLNPILSAGAGASTPSGAIAPMVSPLQAGTQGAMSTAKDLLGMQNTVAQTEKMHADAKLAESNAAVASKTASQKAPFASVSDDANSVYGLLRDHVVKWMAQEGLTATSAREHSNWMVGDPGQKWDPATMELVPVGQGGMR